MTTFQFDSITVSLCNIFVDRQLTLVDRQRQVLVYSHGRRPRRGLGGRSPQNLRWGTANASIPPNIWRSSVIGSVRKY